MKRWVQIVRDVIGIYCLLVGTFGILLSAGIIDIEYDIARIDAWLQADYEIPPLNPLPDDFFLNIASQEDLQQLPGIGEVLAERIVKYREEQGPFKMVEGIMAVEGIGSKKMQTIRDYLIEIGEYIPPEAAVSPE